MHPIEHLRYLARAQGVDALALASETAQALASLRADHANLVIACRRILERHPTVAPLWWLCTRLLAADDPVGMSWTLVDEIDDDRSPSAVAAALPDGCTVLTIGWPETAASGLFRRADVRVLCADSRHEASSFMQRLERFDVECEPIPAESLAWAAEAADVALIDVSAGSSERLLAPVGSRVLAASAVSMGTPVWAVAGIGRRLPHPYVDRIAEVAMNDRHPWDVDIDDIPLDVLARVVSSGGTDVDARVGLATDVPCIPELLRFAGG